MVPWSTCLYPTIPSHFWSHIKLATVESLESQWKATHLCPSWNRFTWVKTCFKKQFLYVFVECSQANPNIFGCRKFSGFDQRLWTQPRLFLDASLLNAGQVARLGTTGRGRFGRDGDADDDYMVIICIPYAPCIVYLPTFGPFMGYMLVNIPYMEHMGILSTSCVWYYPIQWGIIIIHEASWSGNPVLSLTSCWGNDMSGF